MNVTTCSYFYDVLLLGNFEKLTFSPNVVFRNARHSESSKTGKFHQPSLSGCSVPSSSISRFSLERIALKTWRNRNNQKNCGDMGNVRQDPVLFFDAGFGIHQVPAFAFQTYIIAPNCGWTSSSRKNRITILRYGKWGTPRKKQENIGKLACSECRFAPVSNTPMNYELAYQLLLLCCLRSFHRWLLINISSSSLSLLLLLFSSLPLWISFCYFHAYQARQSGL